MEDTANEQHLGKVSKTVAAQGDGTVLDVKGCSLLLVEGTKKKKHHEKYILT